MSMNRSSTTMSSPSTPPLSTMSPLLRRGQSATRLLTSPPSASATSANIGSGNNVKSPPIPSASTSTSMSARSKNGARASPAKAATLPTTHSITARRSTANMTPVRANNTMSSSSSSSSLSRTLPNTTASRIRPPTTSSSTNAGTSMRSGVSGVGGSPPSISASGGSSSNAHANFRPSLSRASSISSVTSDNGTTPTSTRSKGVTALVAAVRGRPSIAMPSATATTTSGYGIAAKRSVVPSSSSSGLSSAKKVTATTAATTSGPIVVRRGVAPSTAATSSQPPQTHTSSSNNDKQSIPQQAQAAITTTIPTIASSGGSGGKVAGGIKHPNAIIRSSSESTLLASSSSAPISISHDAKAIIKAKANGDVNGATREPSSLATIAPRTANHHNTDSSASYNNNTNSDLMNDETRVRVARDRADLERLIATPPGPSGSNTNITSAVASLSSSSSSSSSSGTVGAHVKDTIASPTMNTWITPSKADNNSTVVASNTNVSHNKSGSAATATSTTASVANRSAMFISPLSSPEAVPIHPMRSSHVFTFDVPSRPLASTISTSNDESSPLFPSRRDQNNGNNNNNKDDTSPSITDLAHLEGDSSDEDTRTPHSKDESEAVATSNMYASLARRSPSVRPQRSPPISSVNIDDINTTPIKSSTRHHHRDTEDDDLDDVEDKLARSLAAVDKRERALADAMAADQSSDNESLRFPAPLPTDTTIQQTSSSVSSSQSSSPSHYDDAAALRDINQSIAKADGEKLKARTQAVIDAATTPHGYDRAAKASSLLGSLLGDHSLASPPLSPLSSITPSILTPNNAASHSRSSSITATIAHIGDSPNVAATTTKIGGTHGRPRQQSIITVSKIAALAAHGPSNGIPSSTSTPSLGSATTASQISRELAAIRYVFRFIYAITSTVSTFI
jgi:hypothetical protein